MNFRNAAVAPQQSSGSSMTTHVMQVLLQLPNGVTMPVNIPAAITPQSVTPIGETLEPPPFPQPSRPLKNYDSLRVSRMPY